MTMSNPFRRPLIPLTVMICAVAPAWGDESRFYTGVDLGIARFPDDDIRLGDVTLQQVRSNHEGLTWRLSAGYRLNRYIGFEVAHVDLGEAAPQIISATEDIPGQGQFRFAARAWTVGLVGTFPLRNWEPFAKVEILFEDVDASFSGSIDGAPVVGRAESGKARIGLLAGVRYNLGEHWQFKLELPHYYRLGNADTTGRAKIGVITLGVVYRF